jgi:hypothetical protein
MALRAATGTKFVVVVETAAFELVMFPEFFAFTVNV